MAKQIYGIVGYPVKHSLSPAMQNAAFKEMGIDAEYKLLEIAPDEFESFLQTAPGKGIAGLNVTIPHKIKAKEFIEKTGVLDANASRLGAVNTIKIEGGKLYGFNTDGPGFYRSLVNDLKFEPEGKSILVLGAGGAATAVVMYLAKGPKEIFIFDIDRDKMEALKDHYKRYYDEKRLVLLTQSDLTGTMARGVDLLVNATPVGMKETDALPVDKDMLRPGLYVYDIIYNRPFTELVRAANSAKAHAVTGFGMLVYQGAIAFELWTGKKAPVAVMRRALKENLKF
jgi:shikimate dehydrogenase